jgi:hypothetical protein
MTEIKTVGELIKKLQEFDPELGFQIQIYGQFSCSLAGGVINNNDINLLYESEDFKYIQIEMTDPVRPMGEAIND